MLTLRLKAQTSAHQSTVPSWPEEYQNQDESGKGRLTSTIHASRHRSYLPVFLSLSRCINERRPQLCYTWSRERDKDKGGPQQLRFSLQFFLLFKCNFNVLYLTVASCKSPVANMKGTLSTFKLLDSLGQRGSELRLETVLLIDGVPDIQ